MTEKQRLFLLSVADAERIEAPLDSIWDTYRNNCEKAGSEVGSDADRREFAQIWMWAQNNGYMADAPPRKVLLSKGVRALERTKHD